MLLRTKRLRLLPGGARRGGQGGVDAQLSGVQDVVPEGLQVVGCVCVWGGGATLPGPACLTPHLAELMQDAIRQRHGGTALKLTLYRDQVRLHT